ncbi:MAG: hypothetical protein AB8I58_02295 [Anaerolineales bacterium]
MNARIRSRDLLLVLAGVAGLLSKRWFTEYLGELALSYLGNLSASFAVYFIVSIGTPPKLNRFLVVVIALLIVELFELTDGFGIMTNVYDLFDYLANALGYWLGLLCGCGYRSFHPK